MLSGKISCIFTSRTLSDVEHRQAQELGLHRQSRVQQNETGQVEDTLSLLWYDEYKRRMWINLFIWDSGMAMVLGRPRTINANDCDMKVPMDCEIPSDPSKTVPMPIQPDDKPSAFSERLVQYAIAQKIHEVRTLGADKRHPKDYSLIQTLHNQALALLDTAPPTLQPHNPDTSGPDRPCATGRTDANSTDRSREFHDAIDRPWLCVRQ